MPLACSSIYPKVQDDKTSNRTHDDIKYEWEKMASAVISTSPRYQVSQQIRIVRLSPAALFFFSKGSYSDLWQFFGEWQIHRLFLPALSKAMSFVFYACVRHVFFIGCDTARVRPYIWECLISRFVFLGGGNRNQVVHPMSRSVL